MPPGSPTPTYSTHETLPHALRRWAERDPDRPFVTEVGGPSRTYGELHEAALRWADTFSRAGIAPGDRVPAMVRTSIDAQEQWLGLGWLRAIRTGVNTDFRGNSLAYVLANSRARHVVCAAEFLPRLAEVAARLPDLELIIVPGASGASVEIPDLPCRTVHAHELWDAAEPRTGLDAPRRHEIACISYTSGTTGASKGVLVPWGRLWPEVAWMELGADDVFYSSFPVFHMSGLLPLAWMGFPGGRVLLRESFKTQEFWRDVREHGCTATALIPAMMNWLLDQPERDDDLDNPLRIVTGAPVVGRVDDFKRRFGVQMRTTYSTTEAGMPLFTGPDLTADKSTHGTLPSEGYEVRIVDDHDVAVAPGDIGELVIRTDHPWRMLAGYFEMPDKTSAAWRNGWFHTGDGFVQDEAGRYHFVDRLTDSMRRRGENVSSMEVEAYVVEHLDVVECAAIGVPSEHGEDEIKVCVVLHTGASVAPDELHAFLAERMPTFMVPRYIEFVVDPERTEAMQRIKKPPLRVAPLNAATWDAGRPRR